MYYRNSHYVPIFNLNVPCMAETVSNLALRTNDHINADAVKGLLSNVFVAANLAQGDCGPDALRIILMAMKAMKAGGFQPVAELEKAENGDAPNGDKTKAKALKHAVDAKKSREDREEEAMLKEMEMIVIEEARKADEKKSGG